ncbi:MAG TPA: hypothetical protein V6D11_12005 [Waterburya sp.]|jgi:hypothetical protein
MNGIRSASLLLVLTILSACSSKSSADEVTKELQSVKSWAATAHLVGDSWIRKDVPTAYAKQTLSKAQQELQKEQDNLSQKAPPQSRAMFIAQVQHLQATVAHMSEAVEEKNSQAMSQELQQLSAQEQSVSTLAKTAGVQP